MAKIDKDKDTVDALEEEIINEIEDLTINELEKVIDYIDDIKSLHAWKRSEAVDKVLRDN